MIVHCNAGLRLDLTFCVRVVPAASLRIRSTYAKCRGMAHRKGRYLPWRIEDAGTRPSPHHPVDIPG